MATMTGLALLALLISGGLSWRAAGKLPSDARVPVHAGLGGWDRYVSRRRGLWEWPAAVALVGTVFVFVSAGGPVPVPIYVIFVGVAALILGCQTAAFRQAARGGHPEEAASGPALPRWIAWVLIAVTVVPLVALAAMFLWPRGGPPTTVALEGDQLVMTMRGPYIAFALRSRVVVPLDRVVAASADPQALARLRGNRVGTHAPGVTAGRFTSDSCRAFWAVDNGSHAVVIDLVDADFDRLVAEVEDPGEVVAAIRRSRPLQVEVDARGPCDR